MTVNRWERLAGAAVFLTGPLALAGLWASKRRPSLGAACQVAGAAIFGVCFSWTIVGHILALSRWEPAEGSGARHMGNPGGGIPWAL